MTGSVDNGGKIHTVRQFSLSYGRYWQPFHDVLHAVSEWHGPVELVERDFDGDYALHRYDLGNGGVLSVRASRNGMDSSSVDIRLYGLEEDDPAYRFFEGKLADLQEKGNAKKDAGPTGPE